MTLFNLAAKNVKQNFPNYFLYFVSMVFSIVVFYTFNSIRYNEQVIHMVGEMTFIMLKVGAIAIAIFSAIFMGYSHSFFTKKRKKEIGLYALLGLERKQIARMLYFENLLMGLGALIVGIIMGSLFSKLLIMLFLRLMGHFVRVDFAISPQAILYTVIVFLLLFLFISLHAYSLIYRFKLVDLFRAEASGETEPRASAILAFISIAFIATGYGLAFKFDIFNSFWLYALSVLGLVITGTYGLFHSFLVFAIRMAKKNTARYYQGMNLISISNFMYRIKSNATLLASIAILSATTLTGVGMSYGIYYNINAEMSLSHPFSYEYDAGNPVLNQKVDTVIAKYPQNRLLDSVNIDYMVIAGTCSAKSSNSPLGVYVISESTYTQIAKIRGIAPITLKSPTETLVFSSDIGWFVRNSKIILNNMDQSYTIIDKQDYRLSNTMYLTMVVKDNIFASLRSQEKPGTIRALRVDNQQDAAALTADLRNLIDTNGYKAFYPQYMVDMEQRGVLMFIGAFLGLVMLLATGSIIYFKQMNEAEKEKGNYRILRNIGVNRKEIRTSISKQIFYVFLFPLIIGIAHCSAALAVLSKMIFYQSRFGLLTSTIITILVFLIIYFLYYLLTVNAYNKVVNSDS